MGRRPLPNLSCAFGEKPGAAAVTTLTFHDDVDLHVRTGLATARVIVAGQDLEAEAHRLS